MIGTLLIGLLLSDSVELLTQSGDGLVSGLDEGVILSLVVLQISKGEANPACANNGNPNSNTDSHSVPE